MNVFQRWILALSLLFTTSVWAQSNPQNMRRFVDDLLSQMTLEEKISQLVQYTAYMDHTGNGQAIDIENEIRNGRVGSLLNAYTPTYTEHLQRLAIENSRLKIPLLFGYDVIHGHRTIFPVPLAESASWNLELMERSAHLAAIEASADGIHWTFAPMVDISRDPRWGRVMEGAGEDTWLGSKIAAARVRGFQGQDLSHPDSILACVKHFAAYGAPIAGRDYNAVDMSERELFSSYLPSYESAIRAGAGSIMTAFNEISGVPSTSNAWLFNDLLRKRWGFNGFVVSDYTAVMELTRHGVATDDREAGALALNAGVDVDMVSGIYSKHGPELVQKGEVSESAITESARRVLEAKYKLGLFTDPFHGASEARAIREHMSAEKLAHALDIARRSIVLLKNEKSVLPLRRNGTLALIGPMADNHWDQIGGWSAAGDGSRAVSLLDGVRNLQLPDLKVLHARGATLPYENSPDPQALIDEAVNTAMQADVVVLALGESRDMTGEATSHTQIRVPENQQRLLKAIRNIGKPLVLVLNNGRPLALQLENELADAIVEAWFLGHESGHAVADVLFGNYNPSGKLTASFPYNEGQIPVYYNAKNGGRPANPKDDYTSKYKDAPNDPLFPFGWGLSYSHFEISDLRLSTDRLQPEHALDVSVKVQNKGPYDGEETIQLYIQDVVASVTRPVKELRGFQKVFLRNGESRIINMQLTVEDLKFYDLQMNWVAEPGRFRVMVGSNSKDLLEASFVLLKGSLSPVEPANLIQVDRLAP